MYLRIIDGTPTEISLRALAQSLKSEGVSPPAWWQVKNEAQRNAALARYDVYPFTQESEPTYNPVTQTLAKGEFTQAGDGSWSRGWIVTDIPPAELESNVQEIADNLTANNERDKALALATVDLAIATRDGQTNGLTRAQIRSLFRDRVVFYLRESRGL